MEGSGYGGRAEGEQVAILADCFESFLLFDSEALFFVDDDKSELFKVYVFTEESMGADQYVDAAFGGLLDGISVLCSGVEPADASDVDGQSGKAFIEGVGMLLAKDGGGHEQGDLFAGKCCLECGSYSDFCFAKADISADEAIHWPVFFHIGFGVFNRA